VILARLGFVALAALGGIASCARCGGPSGDAATTGAPAAGASAAPSASASATAAAAEPELPEVKDSGSGRATAALRAALQAYGIPFDAAKLEKECEVDEDGASIDDLEDVAADTYGLDVTQIILPREHVLLADPKVVPGIVIAEGPEDTLDFVLIWKIEGDRALIMDPIAGRSWVPRAELLKRLDVQDISLAAEDWHAAETAPRYLEALRARLAALGVAADKAQPVVDRAAADPGSRALGALDAATRQLEADPGKAGGDPAAFLARAVDCAREAACTDAPIPPAFWSARPAPKGDEGEARVQVRGAVVLAIAGKQPPAAP
jgi:hypothetical protein